MVPPENGSAVSNDLKNVIDFDYDCIVIGCGASGLAAALTLANNDQTVCIIEARDRCGGRINTKFGAGFVGKTQLRVLQYMKELDLELDALYDKGYLLVESLFGKPSRMKSGGVPEIGIRSLLKFQTLIATVDQASLEINIESPWESKHAEFWDSITPAEFIELLLGKGEQFEELKRLFILTLKPVYGVDVTLSKMSMLWFLAGVKSNCGFRTLVDVPNGLQEFNIKGSFQALIDSMADKLGRDKIFLEQPVANISVSQENGPSVMVTTKFGRVLTAKRCIVTLQPSLYDSIEVNCVEGETWKEKLELCEQFQKVQRSYSKVFLKYSEPWWKKTGFSGQAATNHGPASWFYDYSKNGASALGAMVTDSIDTQKWHESSKLERQNQLVEQLQRMYQKVKIKERAVIEEVIDYEEFMWTEETFTNGCVPSLPPDSREQWKTLNTSLDEMVFFAGTALSCTSTGYVDGALISGENAASRALTSLGIVPKAGASSATPGPQSCCFTPTGFTPWGIRMLFAESTEKLLKSHKKASS